MPKFGVSLYSVTRKIRSGEWSPGEAIGHLAAEGAETIELVPFGIDFLGDATMVDHCLKAADDAKVPIENFSLNANFLGLDSAEYDAEMARVKQFICVAGRLGVPTMRIDCASFSRPMETNTTAHFVDDFPLIIATYDALCEYAAGHGITLLLENHGFYINGAERTAQILEAMKGKNFGGQIDVGNYLCVDDMPEAAVCKNIGYATTIHMKDFYVRPEAKEPGGGPGGWFRSLCGRHLRGSILGQGDLDIPLMVKTIKRAGFDGPIFIEYEGMEDCLYGTRVSLGNLKQYWKQA